MLPHATNQESTATNEAALLTKSWERAISFWFYDRPTA